MAPKPSRPLLVDDTSQLSDPLLLGGRCMPNRIVFGAHLTNFGVGRRFTARHQAYYAARVRGGVGMIITEALTVHPQDLPYEHAPCGHAEEITPSLRELATALRKVAGGKAVEGERAGMPPQAEPLLLAQLNHSGGQCAGRILRQSPWAPSPVPDVSSKRMPREMNTEQIEQVIQGFAQAAERVMSAGLDGVEIHAGQHALLRQFLSPLTNFRNDAYGGGPSERLRMLREVLTRVRRVLGAGSVLGLKLCGDELAPWGGLTPSAAGEIATTLLDAVALDYLSIQMGGPYSVHETDAGMPTPLGYGAAAAGEIRKAVKGRLPVFAEGRIESAAVAQQVLDEGQADGVVMTRALISDPDLAHKLTKDHPEPVRPHIGMMRYFFVRGDWNRPLGDLSNPRAGREQILPPPKTRPGAAPALVIGAGPAGLEAALTLARQGAQVTLLEGGKQLGGLAAALAANVQVRREYGLLVDFYGEMLKRLGVKLKLDSPVRAFQPWMREYSPIVLATGAQARPAPITVGREMSALSAREVLLANPAELPASGKALIVDGEGGFRMAVAAERLLELGWEVDVIGEGFFVGRELVESAELSWFKRVAEQGLGLHPRLRCTGVKGRKVLCKERFSGARQEFAPVSLLVHALPELPADNLLSLLQAQHPQVLRVGDAAAPRLMGEAILNAHRTIVHKTAL